MSRPPASGTSAPISYNAVPPAAPTATLSRGRRNSHRTTARRATRSASPSSATPPSRSQPWPARWCRWCRPPASAARSPRPLSARSPNGPTDPFGDAQSFTVTYSIVPPGGSWSLADDGTYSVTLGGSPVTDIDGTAIASGDIGSFTVQGFATTTALSSNRSSSVYGQFVRFTAKVSASVPEMALPPARSCSMTARPCWASLRSAVGRRL